MELWDGGTEEKQNNLLGQPVTWSRFVRAETQSLVSALSQNGRWLPEPITGILGLQPLNRLLERFYGRAKQVNFTRAILRAGRGKSCLHIVNFFILRYIFLKKLQTEIFFNSF